MSGLLAAVVVNLVTVLRVHAEREPNGGIAAVTIRIGAKAGNLVVLATCAVLLAIISGYVLVENFRPRETPYWSDLIR
jgi:hypothetical protein